MPIDSFSHGGEPPLWPWSLDLKDIVKKVEGHKIDHSKDDMRCLECRKVSDDPKYDGPFTKEHLSKCWEGVCHCRCRRL